MTRKKKSNIRRNLFYIRRGLIRWAVVFAGTLTALCAMVYMLEDPNGRMVFYCIAGFLAALGLGNLFYGKGEKE